MLKAVSVDNFRCFSNFALPLEPVALLMGLNGAGKSSLFDALRIVQAVVVRGDPLSGHLPPECLTRWDRRLSQSFAMNVVIEGEELEYALVVEHDVARRSVSIVHEHVDRCRPDARLFDFSSGTVHIFRDDGGAGSSYEADTSRSALYGVPARPGNQSLTRFKGWLEKLIVVRPNPFAMVARTDHEQGAPDLDLGNLASWLRHLLQEDPGLLHRVHAHLGEVIQGFAGLRLPQEGGSSRVLRAAISPEGSPGEVLFAFDELSDGQRMLVALYILLVAGVGPDRTLCIDEPGNFVALSEIQPWLQELVDRADETSGQVVLASHHPEALNFLSHSTVWLDRPRGGSVRTSDLQVSDDGLPASEVVSRGWHDPA